MPPTQGLEPDSQMQLSVVIPVRNEAENVVPLAREVAAALNGRVDYELIFVDDGSTDDTAQKLSALARELPRLRLLRHDGAAGQSTAIHTGVKRARAPWIATLDGDGQNDPADLPLLWEAAQRPGAPDMIAGHRVERRDTPSKRLASRLANAIRRRLLADATPDTGCGLKLFRRDLFLEFPYFDHMHRFLPALAIRAGGRVQSVPVRHRPRRSGRSHYGNFGRALAGIVDLLGMLWLIRRSRRPRVAEEGRG
jgi:dolichol-phosphate mannosyltransferase